MLGLAGPVPLTDSLFMKLLVVDDHPVFRDGLAALLRGARATEQAFAEKRGRDPDTMCVVIGGCGGFVRGGFADDGPDADPFRSPPRR